MSLRTDLEALPRHAWASGPVLFRPVETEQDLIDAVSGCRLREEQERLVNPAWLSIGRAYLARGDNYPCLICSRQGGTVGFINFCKWLGDGDAYSWSYFIDREQQGRGYGRAAAGLAIALLQSANPGKALRLAAEVENRNAQRLYLSLGFRLLPERDGDDLVFGL